MQTGINIIMYLTNVSNMRYSKITYKIKHSKCGNTELALQMLSYCCNCVIIYFVKFEVFAL